METPAAQLVKSGPVADARDAQGELDTAAKEDPAKVLARQKEALAKAEGDMAALQAQALAALTASRDSTTKGNASRQQGMVGSEESMRAKAGAEAKKTFDDAKAAVNGCCRTSHRLRCKAGKRRRPCWSPTSRRPRHRGQARRGTTLGRWHLNR